MIDKRWIGKDLEGNRHGLRYSVPPVKYLEENHKNLKSK
jgi:hypothetical protein